jgi:hypothetical protein
LADRESQSILLDARYTAECELRRRALADDRATDFAGATPLGASVAYYRLVNTLAERRSAFISAEGHVTELDTNDNGTTAVRFRSRGLKYMASTISADDAYLQLSCAMTLEPDIIFDAPLLRALLECQDGFKCAKLSIQREGTLLVSAVELFFADPDGSNRPLGVQSA